MSSKHVRDTVTAAWAGLVPGVTLVPVDNTEPKGMVAPWCALDFTSFSNERDSLGETACYLEEGEIFVNLYVDSGTGNADLITHAQAIADAWLGWESGNVKVVGVSPMEEFPASDGMWYGAIVGIRYEYRYIV